MSIKVKKITYTPADIYAMFATPQIALAAPPSGYANNILGISHDLVYNSTAYTGANYFYYGFSIPSGYAVYLDLISLTMTANNNLPLEHGSGGQGPFSTTKDFYVTTDAAGATGNSNIIAYIIYEQKLIE